MEQQIEARVGFSPSTQQRAERDQSERFRAGRLSGKIEGFLAGELSAKREVLLRLAARAGIPLTAIDHARVLACTDRARLDRWIDSAVGAKSAADLLS
jgi:hypothetical protein